MIWRLECFLVCLLSATGCSSGAKMQSRTYDCCMNGLLSVCTCPPGPTCDQGPPFRSTGGGTCASGPEADAGPDLMEEEPDLPPPMPDLAPEPSPDLGSDTTCRVTTRDADDACPRDARIH
jgi:hypothetical protein